MTQKPGPNPSPSLDAEHAIPIDVDRLIETRLLVQANSGGGKSRTLRRLFEQTYGHVQHLIIDWDGEFHTLREQYDYILAAPHGGDCVANLTSAPLLATRLLQLGVSAILDISELGPQRIKFVQLFLDSVMLAPRDLWHPVLIGIDEAHRFAPEEIGGKDELDCCAAVVSLMSDGRKRGFCGVLATQRISKLDKNAAAECNNLLIGRAALDLDIRRAASVIGMSAKDARAKLPHLRAGEFFVVGPALTPSVELVRMGPVVTTHPTAGQASGPPTPPTKQIRAMLAELGDLPAEAEAEAKTAEQLRKKVRELEGELRRMAGPMTADDVEALKTDAALKDKIARERNEAQARVKELETQQSRMIDDHREFGRKVQATSDALAAVLNDAARIQIRHNDAASMAGNRIPDHALVNLIEQLPAWNPPASAKIVLDSADATTITGGDDKGLSAMQRAMLTVLAQRGPQTKRHLLAYADYRRSGSTDRAFAALFRDGLIDSVGQQLEITPTGRDELGPVPPLVLVREMPDMQRKFLTVLAQHGVHRGDVWWPKRKVMMFAGYVRSGSTDRAWAWLVDRLWVLSDGSGVTISQDGIDALGPLSPVPVGAQLRTKICAEIPEAPSRIFKVLCDAYPSAMTRARVLEQAAYKRSGSTDRAFALLVSREWVVKNGPSELLASPELFE